MIKRGLLAKSILSLAAFLAAAYAASAYEGEVIRFEMEDSQIYPGTHRMVEVYVPDRYDGKNPACLLVAMDGIADYIVDGMDKLMAKGSMPVTIGVFVNPGYINDQDGKVVRYNRSNEYDRTDGRFAEFLENEVIARACLQTTEDGREVKISSSAVDRVIMGVSSGAAAAFSAAWWRPDLYSRVYSIIGTYMPFRDADEYPWLVRKSEPKPLRIFLQDNDKDSWDLLFGSWYEENLRMNSALEYAGYEVSHHWDEGVHSGENGAAIFCEVMEWLWRDWPEPVRKGISGNRTLLQILDPAEEDWKLCRENVGDAMLVPLDDEEPMLVCKRKAEGLLSRKSYPAGPARSYDPLKALYPGGGQAVKATAEEKWVKSYIVSPEGEYMYGQDYYYLADKPYQLVFDVRGYLYAATDRGVQVCDHNGRVRVFLSLPSGPVTSIAFAGKKLYVVSGGDVYVRNLKTGGFTGEGETPERQGQG